MTSVFDASHPHYKIHKDWIQACFAAPNDLPIIQILHTDGVWSDLKSTSWLVTSEYRIKPSPVTKTITYPQPLREKPKDSTRVWIVTSTERGPYRSGLYIDEESIVFLKQALKNGMVFATEEDAQLCYDALYGKSTE